MGVRTTSELVGGIIELDPNITDLDPFILIASILVDRVQAAADESGALDPANDDAADKETVLETIETWLAAHFYAMRDPRTTQEAVGGVQETYQSKVDLGLRLSHYGQMAIALDATGTLQNIADGKVNLTPVEVGVSWLGTPDGCRIN